MTIEEWDAYCLSLRGGRKASEPRVFATTEELWEYLEANYPEMMFRKQERHEGICEHPGCAVAMVWWTGYALGRPRRWCEEHGTPKWAMRRKRAQEARRKAARALRNS